MKMFGIGVEAQKRARYENRCEDEHNRSQVIAVRCPTRPFARYLPMLPDKELFTRLHLFSILFRLIEFVAKLIPSIHAARVRCLISVLVCTWL